MTNQTPQNSRPPKDERQDEFIAVLVALGAIGTIFFWGFNRMGNGPNIASQLDGTPIAAEEIDGEQDGLFAGQDSADDEGGVFSALGLGGGDADGDRTSSDSGDDSDAIADSEQSNGTDLAAVGTAVGGSVLINPGGSDSDSTDPAVADADEDVSAIEEGTDASDSTAAETPDGDQVAVADLDDKADGAEDEATDADATDAETSADEATEVAEVEPPELAVDVPVDSFSDIPEDYWASPFIEGLRQKNVATGFVGGKFEPDTPVSRSQFAAQIYRAFTQDEDVKDIDYSDIPTSHPQYDAIGQVSTSGFMSGYPEGDFRPNDRVSRLEVLIALASGLGLEVSPEPEGFLGDYYGDVSDIPDWAITKIEAATKAGLVVNYGDLRSLNPSQPATRAEASAMLYQALVNLGDAPEVESDYVVKP